MYICITMPLTIIALNGTFFGRDDPKCGSNLKTISMSKLRNLVSKVPPIIWLPIKMSLANA